MSPRQPTTRFRSCLVSRAAALVFLPVLAACAREPAAIKADAIRAGDALVARREFGRAVEAYRTAVESDPADGGVRLKLAKAHLSAEHWTDAANEAVRAADLLPRDVEAQRLATSMLLAQERFADAAARARPLVGAHADDPVALILWGNASARLHASTWALYKLAAAIRTPDGYERERQSIRPPAAPSDDRAAESAFRRALQLAPTLTEAQLALANFLWATGRADEGEAFLRRAADALPADAAVNYALGAFYLANGREAEAEPYLKKAFTAGQYQAAFTLADYYVTKSRDADALAMLESMPPAQDAGGAVSLRVAAIDLRQNRHARALTRLDRLLSREPSNTRALLLKVQALLAAGNPKTALVPARAAVVADAGSAEARVLLGRVLFAGGDPERAWNELGEALRLDPGARGAATELARVGLALGRDPEAVTYARQALKQNADDFEAAVCLVSALIRMRDYAAADDALKPLQSRHPTSPDVLVQAGALNAARGNAAAARAAYGQALQLAPGSLEALQGLVWLDLQEGRLQPAQQRLDQALAHHARDARYFLLAARVAAASNAAPRTESALAQALSIDPTNVDAAEQLSRLLLRQGRAAEAEHVLARVIERRPSSVEAQVALADLLRETGRTVEAQQQYEKVVAAYPRAAVAAFRLARLYVERGGNLDLALDLAIRAKQLMPENPDVNDTLGWVYVRKDLASLAIPQLEDAVRAVPSHPGYRYHLGVAYLSSGAKGKARDELARALRLDDSFPEAPRAREALATLRP
jgi:tetratricopeptide (TPR) repeat protein